MAKYKMLDGKVFQANTPTELIEKMRADSLNPCDSLRLYKIQVSKSAYEYNGSNINIDTDEHFVEDLVEKGFIEIL